MARKNTDKTPKPKNKTYVTCTENNQRVKALIVTKTDNTLCIDLPSGYQMLLEKKPKRKLYVHQVGTLEFVSDGWEVC